MYSEVVLGWAAPVPACSRLGISIGSITRTVGSWRRVEIHFSKTSRTVSASPFSYSWRATVIAGRMAANAG